MLFTVRLYASTTCSRASCSDGILALREDANLKSFCGMRESIGIADVCGCLVGGRFTAFPCGWQLSVERASIGEASSSEHSSAQVTFFGFGEDTVSTCLEESPDSLAIGGSLGELAVSGG